MKKIKLDYLPSLYKEVAKNNDLYLPIEKRGKATLVISHMSTDFGDFSERVRKSGFFEEVVDFDEIRIIGGDNVVTF